MEIEERIEGDIFIISISGRMDTVTSKDVEAKLGCLIDENRTKIILELANVDYISSVGLRTLLAALKRQRVNRGQLALVHLQPFVENIFKITGLDRIFPIYSSEEVANQKLSESQADTDDVLHPGEK
jgi:anti-sigma B factor antagonist